MARYLAMNKKLVAVSILDIVFGVLAFREYRLHWRKP